MNSSRNLGCFDAHEAKLSEMTGGVAGGRTDGRAGRGWVLTYKWPWHDDDVAHDDDVDHDDDVEVVLRRESDSVVYRQNQLPNSTFIHHL
jgi:hypothetical protein